MTLHRRLPKAAAASIAVPFASLLTVAAVVAAPAQAAGGAAEMKVLSPRAGDAVGSHAFSLDVSFRAHSPSAPIVTAELWVDGVRWVRQDLASPQVKNVLKFDVDGSSLAAGTHTVLVKVFAANGAVSETQVDVQAGNDNGVTSGALSGPEMAFLAPGNGRHVSGTIQLNLATRDRNGQNPYVTFYVDNQFKTLKNYPPYTYEWDTTQVSNGFHTIEATGYLDSSDVSTTCRLKVFVDNPGGNTMRLREIPDLRRANAPRSVAKSVAPIAAPKTAAQAVLPAPQSKSLASHDELLPLPGEVTAVSPITDGVLPTTPAIPESVRALVAKAASSAATASATVQEVSPAASVAGVMNQRLTGAHNGVSHPGTSRPALLSALSVAPWISATAPSAPASSSAAPVTASAASATVASASGNVSAMTYQVDGIMAVRRAVQARHVSFGMAPARPASPLKAALAAHRIRISAAAPHASIRPSAHSIMPGEQRSSYLQVAFDGTQIAFDVPPRVEAGLPLAPFRQIFEHTGGQVDWVASTQVVHAVNHDREVVIRVGRRQAEVNGETINMDRAAFVDRGRTIVPLSFVGKALDVDVKYDPATGRLQITSK